jgi:hypothetical protein
LFGGIEALLILTLRVCLISTIVFEWREAKSQGQIPYNKGVSWPDLVVGVVATILLASGLLPPYFELWKRDGRVIGISRLSRELRWETTC